MCCLFMSHYECFIELICLLAIGEQLNCLDIFESIEGLKPETAKLFFFFVFVFFGVFCRRCC